MREFQSCLFCGGDASEPDHDSKCDGRQGYVDDEPPPAPPVIPRHRETSVRAFYNAVDTGRIETRRAAVWVGLSELGEATTMEVFEYIKSRPPMNSRAIASATYTRMTELRDLGVVREVGKRPCRFTGQVCIVWAVVPSSEYAGEASIHRCPTCNQIVSRDVPTIRKVS